MERRADGHAPEGRGTFATGDALPQIMTAMVVNHAGGPLTQVERPLPLPGPGEVRLRVAACGLCHGDAFTVEGIAPIVTYPRIPGHEVIGTIDAVGPETAGWQQGERVGVGWFRGSCGTCRNCRRSHVSACENARGATGMARDGGYATHMLASASALVRIPGDLGSVDAAPLLCAGVTAYNGLRAAGAPPGSVVAVQGVGGVGHLAIQFAARMGYRTVAINRGQDKREAALELGADVYIDSLATDPAAALQAMGGASAIISTVTDADAMASVVPGLQPKGVLIVLGAVGRLPLETSFVIINEITLKGVNAGVPAVSEEMLDLAVHGAVRSRNITFPLSEAQAAYALMMTGQPRFKVVLTMEEMS